MAAMSEEGSRMGEFRMMNKFEGMAASRDKYHRCQAK